MVAVTAATCPSSVSAGSETAGRERPEAGWLRSGTKSQPFDVSAATRGIPGISTTILCPALRLKSIVSDGDTLWIGTEGGLFAWSAVTDSTARVRGPAFNSITAIAIGDDGRLWVGGTEGVSVRDSHGWKHFISERYSFFKRMTGFFQAEGRFWLTTFGQGCGYLDSDTLTILTRADSLLDDRVNVLIEKEDDSLWIGTESGLCLADSFSWLAMRYGAGVPVGPVKDMIVDEEGNLFLAISGQGVARYNLGRVNKYTPRDGLPSAYMRSFSLDPAGTVWVAGKGGLSHYDGSGWTPVNMPGVNLSGYDILSICHDTEESMYLGTDRGRMITISRDIPKETELPQSFPLSSVIDIVEHQGFLWFLSGSRIFRWNGAEFTEIALPDPWYDGALTAMAFDGPGSMWVTTRFGILRFNGKSWEVFDRRLGLPTEYFTWVSPGAGGDIWFGTFDSGILRLTDEGWTHYTELNGIPSGGIIDLVTDAGGSDWLLAASGRIAVAKGGQWQQVSIPFRGESPAAPGPDSTGTLYHRIKYISGAPEDASRGGERTGLCMGLDSEGNVLICRSDGIYRYSPEGWHLIELPFRGEGIEPVRIKGTRRGEIWLGTAGQGVFIRRTGDWLHMGPSSGLSDGYVTALGEDENGRIWCGTRHGGVTVCDIRK